MKCLSSSLFILFYYFVGCLHKAKKKKCLAISTINLHVDRRINNWWIFQGLARSMPTSGALDLVAAKLKLPFFEVFFPIGAKKLSGAA